MRPGDIQLAQYLSQKLIDFKRQMPLPGIDSLQTFNCFVEQLVDSIRRIKYVVVVSHKKVGEIYTDATSPYFDPIKAATWHKQHGNIEEAFWLTFLLTHFGKNRTSGWALTREVYGASRHKSYWTWEKTVHDFNQFRLWLHTNNERLRKVGGFGNHRKYTSLDAHKKVGTGETIRSYLEWVGQSESHHLLIEDAIAQVGNNKRILFDHLYCKMSDVTGFGRTAKFDYLTMAGKLGLADIEPPSTYMHGATGPQTGARLLFGGDKHARIDIEDLHESLVKLDLHLELYFGMQVLEDGLCNWQKSPQQYVHFRG